jgi:hypothetical protein
MAHEVALFHVVTRAEIDFPYSRERRFEDLESGEARIVDPATVARAYREGFAAFLERWRTRARAEGIDYTLVATDAPPAEALRGYLLRRAVR